MLSLRIAVASISVGDVSLVVYAGSLGEAQLAGPEVAEKYGEEGAADGGRIGGRCSDEVAS